MSNVAVITRTKNRPRFLQRAWKESLSTQTASLFEWIIVNDGGDPEPVDGVAELARSRISVTVIHNTSSLGMEAASNQGVNASTAPYLLIHDDDDTLHPSFLEKTTAYLDEHPDMGGVFTNITQVLERITDSQIRQVRSRKYTSGMQAIYLGDFLGFNPFVPISFLYRRSIHDAVGLYDESLPVIGDWEFFIRAIRHCDMGLIQDYLAYYHIRVNGNGADQNTVTAKKSLHAQCDAAMRNRYLREDLQAGKMGLGVLMNREFRDHYGRNVLTKLDRIFNMLSVVKRMIGR
jgi:glycosyltransferase involved in cell wall biosynthesis